MEARDGFLRGFMLPLWDTVPNRRPTIVTQLLIAGNFAVFGWQLWLLAGGGAGLDRFMVENALVPARLLANWRDGREWLTLLTHMFMHGGALHLLGNMWFLWVFGRSVEERLGAARYALLYVFSGLVAAGAQILSDPSSTIFMVGASGAISGVLGAYFVLLPTAWVVTLVPWIVPIVPVPAVVFLVIWFVVQALNGVGTLLQSLHGVGGEGGVAWWAHAGGFAAGVAATLWAKRNRWVRSR